MQRAVKVKVSDLMKKFKHRDDRYNFCRQKDKKIFFISNNILYSLGFWLPNEVGFDATFFVQFLTEEKEVREIIILYNKNKLLLKLLPTGKHSDYKLNYFRGDGSLTKGFLIKIVKSKIEYEKYIPNKIKYENLSKDFLFSVS